MVTVTNDKQIRLVDLDPVRIHPETGLTSLEHQPVLQLRRLQPLELPAGVSRGVHHLLVQSVRTDLPAVQEVRTLDLGTRRFTEVCGDRRDDGVRLIRLSACQRLDPCQIRYHGVTVATLCLLMTTLNEIDVNPALVVVIALRYRRTVAVDELVKIL